VLLVVDGRDIHSYLETTVEVKVGLWCLVVEIHVFYSLGDEMNDEAFVDGGVRDVVYGVDVVMHFEECIGYLQR